MTPVRSSAFSHVDYNERAQSLTVQFHSGDRHRYDHVGPALYDEMKRSASMGRFFAIRIKPHHPATKVS
jgi:hypothetical protein